MKKIFIIIILLQFISCETVLEVELPETETKIVVNTIIGTKQPAEINLSESKSILSTEQEVKVIKDAQIKLMEKGEDDGEFTQDIWGTFYSNSLLSEEIDYTLQVESPNFPKVTCNFKIPKPIAIRSVIVKEKEKTEWDYTYTIDQLEVEIDDPAGEINYYMIAIFESEDGETNSSTDYQLGFYPDAPFDTFYDSFEIEEGKIGFAFTDGAYDGETIKYSAEIWNTLEEDKIYYCELFTINEALYLYLKSREQQDDTDGNPFAQPVTVYSNIDGGIGIVGTYSSAVKKIEIRR